MNPYLALPRRRTRLAWWWVALMLGIIVINSFIAARSAQQDHGGGEFTAVVIVAALLVAGAVIAVLGGSILWASSHRRRVEHARPGATVFLTGRGAELSAKLVSIGFLTGAFPERMAVTVDDEGVGLWGRNITRGPLVMLRRDHLMGLIATTSETGDPIRRFRGPALGVIARLNAPAGGQVSSLLLPIQIWSPHALSIANADYAWGILKSASRVLPVMASPLS